MEFRQLRYFVAVAEEGNLTAASRRLNVSQPPVTRQIKQLEFELGAELLHRSSTGVRVTPAGEAFLSEARRLLNLSSVAIANCRAASRGEIGHLDVGYFGSTIYTVVPELVRRFRDVRPGVEVQIERLSKEEQIARLRDGRIGIGFARYYSIASDLNTITVGSEELFTAKLEPPGGVTTPPAALAELLHGQPLILFPQTGRPSFADEVLRICSALDAHPDSILTAEDALAALAMVLINKAVCIVPGSVARLNWPGISFQKIDHPIATSPVNCVFLNSNRPPVVEAFLHTLETATTP